VPGVLASLFVALNAIFTKRYLPAVDGSILRLGLVNNVNAALIFVPFMLLGGEIPVILSYPYLTSVGFWVDMSIAGFLGFAVGAASALQIKVNLDFESSKKMKLRKNLSK
jgi:GDP-fucose transporter C1